METLTESLKHIDKDPTKVKELMKETAHYRRDYIHQEGDGRPSLAQIRERFPHLMDDGMVGFYAFTLFKCRLLSGF